jgi:hypothetical protein
MPPALQSSEDVRTFVRTCERWQDGTNRLGPLYYFHADVVYDGPRLTTPATKTSLCSLLQCLAILLLGETLARARTGFDWIALISAAVAILLVAAGIFFQKQFVHARWIDLLASIGILIGIARLPLIDQFINFPGLRQTILPFIVLAGIAALLSLLILIGRPRSLTAGIFALLLLDFLLMGWFFLNLSADPHIDVYLIQQMGCDALLHGHNPFAITFPDLYGPAVNYYPVGIVASGIVQCGYFYPPLSLLLALPGFLAGDVRFTQLAAVILTAGLIGFSTRRYRFATWLLFTPNLLFILENAWIEPIVALLLAITVCSHNRRWVLAAAISWGLFLASKQYLLLTLPAGICLLGLRPTWRTSARFLLPAAIAAGIVTLPFMLWDARAFLHSTTALYTNIIRPDSISFLPILSQIFHTRLTLLCSTLAAVPASLLVLSRSPRTASGFAAAVALIALCVFIFGTQAFINYYFLAVAALLTALTSEPVPTP